MCSLRLTLHLSVSASKNLTRIVLQHDAIPRFTRLQVRQCFVGARHRIGRAGLIASTLLIETGISPSEAIERVSVARHAPVPETAEQRDWVESFAATLNRRR
jgi:hypothetical protein